MGLTSASTRHHVNTWKQQHKHRSRVIPFLSDSTRLENCTNVSRVIPSKFLRTSKTLKRDERYVTQNQIYSLCNDFFGLTSDPFALATECLTIRLPATAATSELVRFQKECGAVERKLLSDVMVTTHASPRPQHKPGESVSMNDTERQSNTDIRQSRTDPLFFR